MTKLNGGLRTWIEVDKKAIVSNYKTFRGLISKKTKLMAVVKSNAYGHSLIDFSREVERLGADWLGVDSIVEALALRREGIRSPILVLGYTFPERFKEAADNDISLTVSTFDNLTAARKFRSNLKQPLKIQIKVDTGMHRQGFLAGDLPKILSLLEIRNLPVRQAGWKLEIEPEGLYTHFASAKNPAFPEHTKRQIVEFEKWRGAFKKAGLKVLSHASATAGAMLFPEAHYDMVRIGIGLYGLWPAKEVEAFYNKRRILTPALSWKSIISEIKELPSGAKIGYDSTEALSRRSKIAVCPVGYWHGYPRSLSSIGQVLVRARRAKVLGRVSMDMLTIDISDISGIKVGDEVTLIGASGKEKLSAHALADLSDSSWYEIITRLNPLIKRIYI